jgi:hypothetical protein
MSLISRRELIASVAGRYGQASREEQHPILTQFVATTGYHRKYAIALLNHPPSLEGISVRDHRPRQYDQEVEAALIELWEVANRICSKRLVPFLPALIEAVEGHGHLELSPEVRTKLLSLSPATVDRLLHRVRLGTSAGGLSTTRRGTLLKHQIPVRTFAEWGEVKPGFFEADLVAHCGGSLTGSYLHSLVLTDVASGWIECNALLVRDQRVVVEAFEATRQRLIFPLLGLDTDNGSEFINQTLIDYCQGSSITFTRARPYRKNDQCPVEQKNGSVVRRWVGYERFEGVEACRVLTSLYEKRRLYINYFQPSVKLLEKTRRGSHVTKRYDRAQTPCQRLLDSAEVNETIKAALQAELSVLDPVGLLAEIERLQDRLWQLAQPIVDASESSATSPTSTSIAPSAAEGEDGSIALVLKALGSQLRGERSNRQYRHSPRPKRPRTWRTRKDPFAAVWEELKTHLAQHPELTAKELLEWVQLRYPGQYTPGQLRTLHRRVKAWREQQAIDLLTPFLRKVAPTDTAEQGLVETQKQALLVEH